MLVKFNLKIATNYLLSKSVFLAKALLQETE